MLQHDMPSRPHPLQPHGQECKDAWHAMQEDIAPWCILSAELAAASIGSSCTMRFTVLVLDQALYGGGLKYAKVLDLLGPGWIVELDHNAANSMGSNLAGWRFGI